MEDLKKFWVRGKPIYNSKRGHWEPGPLVTLVAFTYEDGLLRFTSATCHPRDRFSRKFAHDHVKGLFEGMEYEALGIEKGLDIYSLKQRILGAILQHDRDVHGDEAYERRRFQACAYALKELGERNRRVGVA